MKPARITSFALGVLLAALAASAPARADVETAVYFNDQLFSYKVKHMPDIDQRRTSAPGVLGLPLDGAMHCAPTSALNMMIYCANHGFAEVWPGPGDYQNNLYDVATLNDLALGISMGTDGGGSGGQAMFEATKTWLNQSAPGKFTVSSCAADGTYAPLMTDLAEAAIDGGIVSICYGRYAVIGTFNGTEVLQRSLGHCVTVSRALRNGPYQLIGLRDPADSTDSWISQSTFGTREALITDRKIAGDFSASQVRTMSSIGYDVTKEKNAYIDRYILVKPKQGYSWQPSPLTITTNFNVMKVATFLGGSDSPGDKSYSVEGLVLAAAMAPEYTSVLMVVSPKGGGPAELLELNLLDGKVAKLASVPGAKSIHFSRRRTLYVAAPNLITAFDLLSKKALGSAVPPAPVEAIAYDDKADELVLLCSDAKKLLRWKEGLGGAPKVIDLPAEVVMGGAATIAIDPTDGEVFFATEKSPAVFGVSGDGSIVPCILPEAQFPTALDLDDLGHLFAVSGGILTELAYDAATGWKKVDSSPFSGKAVGKAFHVTRSRHNLTAAHTGPEWDDVDPSQLNGLFASNFIPDCNGAPSNSEYGAAKAGTFGFPHLEGVDPATLGVASSIRISHALPGATPVLLLGVQKAALPFDGGLIHLAPTFVFAIPVPIGADGSLTITGVLPGDPALCGFTLYHQVLFADPGAPGFYHTALTNGLARTFGS